MATFEVIEHISVSRWEDPSSVICEFPRPTDSEIDEYSRQQLRRQQHADSGRKPPVEEGNVQGFGRLSLFQVFDQVEFRRDSDLLLRFTPHGGRVYLRRDGTFYSVGVPQRPNEGSEDYPDLVLKPEEYSELIRVIATDIVQKEKKPGLPFEGSALIRFSGKRLDGSTGCEMVSVRISGLPSLGTWSVCMRFIPTIDELLPLDSIYLIEAFQDAIRKQMLSKSQGLLLISGPTGHGKTTAAYSILRELTTSPDGDLRHMLTIEDPIECRLDNATQIEVNMRGNFGFAEAFHGALRHGPEVFFFGEIRSSDAARAAIQAALSGHFTLATIHGGSTIDAISRLIGYGVSPRELCSALLGVINHRLVPRLCTESNCSAELDLADPVQQDLQTWAYRSCWKPPAVNKLRRHVRDAACPVCRGHGKVGRVLLASITRNTRSVTKWLLAGAHREEAPNFEAGAISFSACAGALAMDGIVASDDAYCYSLRNSEEEDEPS